jgi:flagellar motor switch protein FliN
MSADALSQDEIDALLKGAGGGSAEVSAPEPPELTPKQSSALSVYTKAMAGTLGDMIGTFLATASTFSPVRPAPRTSRSAAEIIHGNLVYVIFSHQGRLHGDTALLFLQEDACKIGGTMVGDPNATEFSDMVADAFKEVMSTVLGNLNTALSGPAGGSVTTTPVQVEPMAASADNFTAALNGGDQLILIPYEMNVTNTIKGRCWQLYSIDLVESVEVLAAPPAAAPKPAAATAIREAVPTVKAAPVQFDSLTDEPPPTPAPSNLDLLMDIELEVRVELGRSSLKIRDVLKLGTGSVVELDKLAGEPVDLLVNDVIFAKGEVVVIDENFGVRITDILSLADRVKTFGERKS